MWETLGRVMALALMLGLFTLSAGATTPEEKQQFTVTGARMTPIGINCRICPRANCDQRAHHAAILSQPIDERRRGATRYDS